mmetsp:Transcript_124702/g.360745  ORF Transcript_124702/g.360745 Transcript_124702/m.360745 type:complete len:310 (+) Transcript_124702:1398-2327(+)
MGRPSTSAPSKPSTAASAALGLLKSTVPVPLERPSGCFHKSKWTTFPCPLKRSFKKPSGVSNKTFLKNTLQLSPTSPLPGPFLEPFPSPFWFSELSSSTQRGLPSTSTSIRDRTAFSASSARLKRTVPLPRERPSGRVHKSKCSTRPHDLNFFIRKPAVVSKVAFLKNTFFTPLGPVAPLPPLPPLPLGASFERTLLAGKHASLPSQSHLTLIVPCWPKSWTTTAVYHSSPYRPSTRDPGAKGGRASAEAEPIPPEAPPRGGEPIGTAGVGEPDLPPASPPCAAAGYAGNDAPGALRTYSRQISDLLPS